jgi:hypothetical protein
MEFDWAVLPDDVLECLANFPDLPAGEAVDPEVAAERLAREIGPAPTSEHAFALWRVLRDAWILPDAERVARIAGMLRELMVGRAVRSEAEDDADYIARVRTSTRLRTAVVRMLLALGSGPSDDLYDRPLERAIAADRRPYTPSGSLGQPVLPDGAAPTGWSDFMRLDALSDLGWSLFATQVFDAAEELLPGEGFVLEVDLGGPANGDHESARATVAIIHGSRKDLNVVLGPEDTLPAGVTYSTLMPALAELGWAMDPHGTPATRHPWPEGIDDAAVQAVMTFKNALLVPSPLQVRRSDEFRQSEEVLPAPPGPHDVVVPESPREILAVADSIVRAMGGQVMTGADPLTHGFRLGDVNGWLHADGSRIVLDIAVVVTVLRVGTELDIRLAAHALDVQSREFRLGRLVFSGTSVLVVASVPIQTMTGASVQAVLIGLMADAEAAVAALAPMGDAPTGEGGYL